jgi:N-acetylneuraminic acid mutarotase
MKLKAIEASKISLNKQANIYYNYSGDENGWKKLTTNSITLEKDAYI